MAKIEVTSENLNKCRCPQCPVQEKSQCNAKAISSGAGKLFCAKGRTGCNDFDRDQWCSCPNCLVWQENKLKYTYYCLNGSAEEVGG